MAILELDHLTRHFEIRPGFIDRVAHKAPSRYIKAVESLNINIYENEILGIAGESGCGKSTTCTMIAGLLEPTSGDIRYQGKSIVGLTGEERREHHRKVQMIFQDPY